MNNINEDILFPDMDADAQHFTVICPHLRINTESKYYDIKKINSLNIRDTDVALFLCNSRSIGKHEDELRTLV